MKKFYEIQSPIKELFDDKVELLPSVTELFEVELAYLEYKTLDEKEYAERTAFAKSYNGNNSLHFLRYSKISEEISKNRTSTILFFTFSFIFLKDLHTSFGLIFFKICFVIKIAEGLISIPILFYRELYFLRLRCRNHKMGPTQFHLAIQNFFTITVNVCI